MGYSMEVMRGSVSHLRHLSVLGAILGGVLLSPPRAGAATLDVPGTYPRITDALCTAGPGDTIEVAAGTYSPSANAEVFPLLLEIPGLLVRGAGMEVTVVDAEGQESVFRIEDDCRVTGFTVTGGRGAVGGGIRVEGGNPEIDANLILGNEAESLGSGINIRAPATAWIHHNIVWDNRDANIASGGDPHGIQFAASGGLVENNVVGRGDSNGLLVDNGSTPLIRNNIFFENGMAGPPLRGRGICALLGHQAIIAYNLFFGNQIAALLVSGVGNLSAADANDVSPADSIYGNLDGEPAFISVDALDLHLRSTSPAIDTGDPGSPLDPDGTRADMGVYYFDQATVGFPEGDPGPRVLLGRPNPFALSTSFSFVLERPGPVRVAVYDVRGRRVVTLLDETRPEGRHEAAWDGRTDAGERAPSGVYFVRLETAEGVRRGKVALLP